jgi:Flp pilus assembly protein TadG
MFRGVGKALKRAGDDRRGNVTMVTALALPVIVGSLGLGAEVASWHNSKRALQNAADSAAIAAATNGTADGYDDEARAVAAQYGFRDGADGVNVAATNSAPCPAGGSNCYAVTITRAQPLLLAQVVGFKGDTELDGAPAKLVAAKAVAIQTNAPREYCILALATSGDPEALRANGVPNANLTGCNVMSNSNARCNGHDLGAEVGDAHGTNNGCGRKRNSNVPTINDPYAGLASNIPTDNCGEYYKAPAKKKDADLPSSNTLHGLEDREVIDICGDAKLNGPVLINSSGHGTVLIIRNGGLDLNGYTLQTQGSSSLTIIFTGKDPGRLHAPTGDGTFDIKAPTTGPWKGVAIYQDPATTGSGVNINEAGNKPTWNITGLVYLPHASVTFSGAVNKSSNGAACFGLVADNVTVNGTGSIFSHGQCAAAGLTLPYSQSPTRGRLVS